MDVSCYKEFLLCLLLYKFLNNETLKTFRGSVGLGMLPLLELVTKYANNRKELRVNLDNMIQKFRITLRYF